MQQLQSPVSYRKILSLLTLVTTLLFLSGCGFHLKNINGLVEKFPDIYLQTNAPNGELTRFVKIRLRGANINILTEPNPDVAVLRIISERQTERTISLYANGQNAEKEIGYIMNYSLKMPHYTAKHYSVNVYRDFLDNPAQALAKSREAELLTKELRAIAADHIIATMLSMKNEEVE